MQYKNPISFKQALEQRIRNQSKTGMDIARRRQLVVYDRLLARLTHVIGHQSILKGGLSLELRLDQARTTKDVDLQFYGQHSEAHTALQKAGAIDLDDFMHFEIKLDPHYPAIQNEGME